ncbi:type I methionyl aminopeptidase [Pontibacillus salicampi]|uniref:Methionine aminopeptidase n=1 Tax=Pontibacillus salicampi TaxID=1449801 RepID=A0ABV6LNC7_9BACI
MITRKSAREIDMMQRAGQLVADCHKEIAKRMKPGITTMEIDAFVEEYMAEHGATPEQKGFQGYKYATCASINDEVCHGFPRNSPLEEGDIVTIDMVANLNGGLADSAWSYRVGTVSEEADLLLTNTEQAMWKGIEQAVVGNRLGDIGHAIQSFAEDKGYGVVREFTGHGLGPTIHEEPSVLHYGTPGTGKRLKEGMVITIEPMLNIGKWHTTRDDNGWTARTLDGTLSAQYEHTIAITKDGPLVLTVSEK